MNLAEAQAMLDGLAKRSPKHRYILDSLKETQQVIDQLPRDTAQLQLFQSSLKVSGMT
ncbi:MAG: hypothetical protein ACLPZY_15270 [Terracidiphilus sp.]